MLLNNVLKTRDLTNIFLSEKEFKKEENHLGGNPQPGRNLLEKLDRIEEVVENFQKAVKSNQKNNKAYTSTCLI